MKEAKVFYKDKLAGILSESEDGYSFQYDEKYLSDKNNIPVSLTLPLEQEMYVSNIMFPFFDGLIPEGWLLDIATENWKLNPRDRMGLLMSVCKDCIGAVSIIAVEEKTNE